MKKTIILISLLMACQTITPAFGATKTCSSQASISLLKLAIDYNDNRANFLKFLIYVNASNDGIIKSRNEGDSKGEAGWQKNYYDASSYALGWANKGLQIEKKIRSELGKCKSGYGVNYSSNNGYISMNKKIKGIRFQSFKIPALVTMPIVSPTSVAPTTPTVAGKDRTAQNAGVGTKCVVGTSCLIGSTGPGGGVVFYDAGTQQNWGRYLEFAPNGWFGTASDPEVAWCNRTDIYVVANKISGWSVEIGKGKANTNAILEDCTSGAAVLARGYIGGGKSDWYLPAGDELNEVCKYALNQPTGDSKIPCRKSESRRGGFVDTPYSAYWASNETGPSFRVTSEVAWYQRFNNEDLYARGDTQKYVLNYVRPIRAF